MKEQPNSAASKLKPIDEDGEDDCLTAFQKYGRLRYEQRQVYLKNNSDNYTIAEEAALSLGSSVFDNSKNSKNVDKAELKSLNKSESKNAMMDKLLQDIITVKDSVVPPHNNNN